MIKRIFILLIVYVFINPFAFSQEDCSILLRRAQKFYDDGIIEEVPPLLSECIESGFTREERVEAYKLLILCSIYEDNIDQADKKMLTFLKSNPEYEINPSVDAAEFIHFFNSYNTTEIISFGLTIGTNFSNPYYTEQFGTHDLNAFKPSYSNSGFGFIIGPRLSRPINKEFEISLSLLYGQKQFTYNTNITEFSNVSTIETHNVLEFPIMVSYYKFGNKTFKPFVTAGVNVSYLLDAKSVTDKTFSEGDSEDLPGTEENILSKRNQLLYGISIGPGMKYKFNKGAISAILRYNFGVNTMTIAEERYSVANESFEFGLVDDKIILNNLYFSVSFSYPLYNHKKIN